MRKFLVMMVVSLLFVGAAWAQAPANPPSRVAVIDFQRALTENTEGKKAADAFMKEVGAKQAEFTKIQKEIETIQTDLQTKAAALSEPAKAAMAKQIDDKQTLLTRMNEDAQRDVPEIQQRLLGPIAERTQRVIKAYGDESGLAAVFDISAQSTSGLIHWSEVADITTEIIRRIDADIAKSPAPAAPAPAAPTPAPAAPRQ